MIAGVGIDTQTFVGYPTAMMTHRSPVFEFRRFSAGELVSLVGMTPVAVRDWRRRDLLHPDFGKDEGGFHFAEVAELLFLKRLSEHGIGPKRLYGWASSIADLIVRHVAKHPDAWADGDAWAHYQAHEEMPHAIPLRRYVIIRTPPRGYAFSDRADEVLRSDDDVATIIDMQRLAAELLSRIDAPIGTMAWEEIKVLEVIEPAEDRHL